MLFCKRLHEVLNKQYNTYHLAESMQIWMSVIYHEIPRAGYYTNSCVATEREYRK